MLAMTSWVEWLAAAGIAVAAAALGAVCGVAFLVWLAGRPLPRR